MKEILIIAIASAVGIFSVEWLTDGQYAQGFRDFVWCMIGTVNYKYLWLTSNKE